LQAADGCGIIAGQFMNLIRFICGLGCVACLAGGSAAAAAGTEFMEYNITWVGISVGTMTLAGETNEPGDRVRTLRLWNRPWIALVYPVDTVITCRIEATEDGPRHTVHKKVQEHTFRQDDTLVLWPDLGRAVWSNALRKTVRHTMVPKGSRDLVSFFFDLREVFAANGAMQIGGDYQLVMDGAIHGLEITTGAAKTLRTPFGRMEAVPVEARSKSPALFSRNRPESVWVATARPAVLFADIVSRFGPVRATLVKWEIDGQPVEWKASEPRTD